MLTIPLSEIHLSKTNPRRRLDQKADADLLESVRQHGILQPVLVRPMPDNGAPWELVAGARRFAAAKAAGLTEIPVIEKSLTDIEALEVQVIENLQRADVHPLEEAEGYRQLSAKPGYDVAKVAERVGRSVKYVYDRMKLLALTKEVKQLFLEDRIAAGHAILLARLSPSTQTRAIEAHDAVFEAEHTLWDPAEEERESPTKARSVRELQAWIDQNVRFDAKAPDPMLFPETAEEVARAQKVVPITFSHYIAPEARDGKTFGPRSWKRADGQMKSKPCELSTTGVVMVGPHRGEAFAVCVAKEKCAVHWGAEMKARKQRAAQAPKSAPAAKKAESPKTEARRVALEKALREARERAFEELAQRIIENAVAMSPEKFIRKLAQLRQGEVARVLRAAGEKLKTEADVAKWIQGGPLPQLQRHVIFVEMDYFDEVPEVLGIDKDAIFQRHEREAREAFKLQASAAAKAAKPAKRAAKKKAGAK